MLFWSLWIIDLFLLILTAMGSDFRSGFGAGTGFNNLVLIITVIAMIAGLVVRYFFHQNKLSLLVVTLPMLVLFLIYIFEKITGVGE